MLDGSVWCLEGFPQQHEEGGGVSVLGELDLRVLGAVLPLRPVQLPAVLVLLEVLVLQVSELVSFIDFAFAFVGVEDAAV